MRPLEQSPYVSTSSVANEVMHGAHEAVIEEAEASNAPVFDTYMDEGRHIEKSFGPRVVQSTGLEETKHVHEYFGGEAVESATITYMTELNNCKQEILRIEKEISKYAGSSLLEKITHFIAGHDLENAWKNAIRKKKTLEGKLSQQQNGTIYH